MLNAFGLSNFRSYQDATLHLAPLTMLIGANASGKSNAIEGLRLLSWLAQGGRLYDLQRVIQDGNVLLRGRVQDIFMDVAYDVTFNIIINNSLHLNLCIKVNENGALHISYEELFELDKDNTRLPSYSGGTGSDKLDIGMVVEYNNYKRGGNKPKVSCSNQYPVFNQLDSPARFNHGHAKSKEIIPGMTAIVRSCLSDILFLDPVPGSMRGYSFKNEEKLLGDGKNLSSVLFHLWGGNKKAETLTDQEKRNRDHVLTFIRSLPEQDIETLSFIETPRNEVMLQLRETFGEKGKDFDVTLLSDGTLRVLAIAAALLSVPEGGLVVIEEIDNGIHPSRAEGLMQHIAALAERRNLRVLLTSHNPAMLDALPDSAIPDVVFCYRDKDDGYSKLVRLQDVPDYPELIARGNVGRLMTTGFMEQFVKFHPGSEEKKRKAREWLKKLRKKTSAIHENHGQDLP
ncbi:MAG: AAA family ATPase [Magnetococcales bacterium]|nr:AAA family ATPase [Magnetococcales bacterium]